MERIPEDKMLEYNPDTMVAIRRLYNLDKPGQMDQAIDLLDDWVKKQTHFVRKEYPREYLERIIILLKGSVERAKWQLDKICTLRTLLPHFFDKFNAKNDVKPVRGYVNVTLLPKLTEDHYRIFFIRYEPNKSYKSNFFFTVFIFSIMICEYLKAHDYSDGIICVLDCRDVNIMDLVSQINIAEMRQMFSIGLEGYDCRAKNFFFISKSKTIEVFTKVFKQMMSEKLGKRIHVIKNVEELHEHLDRKLLPSDYGGEEMSLESLNDKLLDVLSSKENIEYLKIMNKCRTNESMRTTSKAHEQFLELTGTFRSLSVD